MSLKTFKPYTKSRRTTILVDKSNLWKGKPYKALTEKKKASKGRTLYRSPELIKKDPHDEKCDIWSCGVILYILLNNIYLYYASHPLKLQAQ